MTRISSISTEHSDPSLTAIFDQERNDYGAVLNPTQVMAHRPEILKAARGLYHACDSSALIPMPLLSLLYARVAALNGCPF